MIEVRACNHKNVLLKYWIFFNVSFQSQVLMISLLAWISNTPKMDIAIVFINLFGLIFKLRKYINAHIEVITAIIELESETKL